MKSVSLEWHDTMATRLSGNGSITLNFKVHLSLAKTHVTALCSMDKTRTGFAMRSMWWYMMTSSNGNLFRVTGHLCGEFTGPRWIPHTKASDAELWCLLDLGLKKRLSKQWWGWWFEMLSRLLWCHCNDKIFQNFIRLWIIKNHQSSI